MPRAAQANTGKANQGCLNVQAKHDVPSLAQSEPRTQIALASATEATPDGFKLDAIVVPHGLKATSLNRKLARIVGRARGRVRIGFHVRDEGGKCLLPAGPNLARKC